MSKYPWLNDQPRLASGREWKEQYEQNWASQFEKAEEVFLVVPTEFVEKAKQVVAPIQENMQLVLERKFEYCPLSLLSRFFKPSGESPSKLLLNAYIPHILMTLTERYGRPYWKMDAYYWHLQSKYVEHVEFGLPREEDMESTLIDIDKQVSIFDWQDWVNTALEIKTIILLKGTNDGLPKTHVESQNWAAHKR